MQSMSCRAVALVFCCVAGYALAESATVSLPENWADGESLDASGGYVSISSPKMISPAGPVAAPSLPVWVFEVDLPEGALIEGVSSEVSWSDPEPLAKPLLPISAAVAYPRQPVIPEPDPAIAALDQWPAEAVENGGVFKMRGKRVLALRLTPYLYNPKAQTLRRAVSAKATVTYSGGSGGRKVSMMSTASAESAKMVIVSPPAFTNLWEAYADYRKTTHPDISIAIKNTEEIYSAYPDAVASNDYALAIHQYLESLYREGEGNLEIVLLGAGAPGRTSTGGCTDWTTFTNKFLPFDPDTQIPTRYPVSDGLYLHEASDLYYACMDKLDCKEVWDYDGDGIYMGTLQTDGTFAYEDASYSDWAADLQVMRVPIQPLIVETSGSTIAASLTAEDQMTNFIAKLRYLDSGEWKGAGVHAVGGDTVMDGIANLKRGCTDYFYIREQEFCDGGLNHFDPENRESVVINEAAMRYRVWQYAGGTRANGVTRHAVGLDWCDPGVYGSGADALSTQLTQAEALSAIKSVDQDSFFIFSHGWARGAPPISATELLRGQYTGVTRFHFAPEPCDTGMIDYSWNGQTTTNAVCLGAAAVLSPGGAAASFNNSRLGMWTGFDASCSSALEGFLIAATYNGNCTNALFDIENPCVSSPVTIGEAFLLMRQHAASRGYGVHHWNGACLLEVMGFGDPLVTLSPQGDAQNDFSTECVRKLTLTSNPTIATTNAAAVLDLGSGVTSISGSGILRATVETGISGDSLDFAVAGGMGRKVAFANAGGKLTFSGKKKRYVGPAFENVGEIAVTGSGVTVDFGLASENATACPVDKVSFCASSFGTNIIRNANVDKPGDFFTSPIGVSRSILRAQTTSPFPAAITNGELRIETNPLWTGVAWDKEVTIRNGRFVIAQDGFSFADGATFNVPGANTYGYGGEIVNETDAEAIEVSGDVTINLSNSSWFFADMALKSSSADATLTVRGMGTLYLPEVPLKGFSSVVVGEGTTLILPGSAGDSVMLIAGAATSTITFEGTPNIYLLDDPAKLTESYWGEYVSSPVVRGGYIVPDNAANALNPPYARTLSAASESWFDSSDWIGNGVAFADTWRNSQVYTGDVNLSVSNGVEEIALDVEDIVAAETITVADSEGASWASDLTVTASNGLYAAAIDASGFTGALTLDFPTTTAAITAGSDTHLAEDGTGSLTIPAGGRATLYSGAWSGTVSNSGVIKRADTVSMASADLVAGTNSFVNGTITSEDTDTGHHFLVEDGDTLTIYGRKRAQGFCVTGGSLTFSQTSQGVWFGGKGKPYVQTGGAVTIDCAAASASSPYEANTACNLQWTGSDAYSMTVSGGTFDVPNGYLLFWNDNATFTVTGEGLVSAKGVSANASSPSNRKLSIRNGGFFVLGEFGIAPQAPAITVSKGVLASSADATINAAINLSDATLAAAPGKTLTIAKPFASATGTLTIGTAEYTGTVDFGTNRVSGVTLNPYSCGTLAFKVSDDEATAGTASLIPCDSFDEACYNVVCYTEDEDGNRTVLGGGATVVDGALTWKASLDLPDSATALAEGDCAWSSLSWKDGDGDVISGGAYTVSLLDSATLVVTNESTLSLDTVYCPDSLSVTGGGRLTLSPDLISSASMTNLTIGAGTRVETDSSHLFNVAANEGIYRVTSTTNIVLTDSTLAPGTNSYSMAAVVGNTTDATCVVVVGEEDSVSFSPSVGAVLKEYLSFCVTGGSLTMNNSVNSIWLGAAGSSQPFIQTGGTVTFNPNTSYAHSSEMYRGVHLGRNGSSGTYDVIVSGGLFTIPSWHLNLYDRGTLSVTGAGVVSVKGILANSSTATALSVANGGTLEIGSTGIGANIGSFSLSAGTICAFEDATISPAMDFAGGTLAATNGATLTVSGGFSSASGTLKVGAEGWDGTVDFGTSRLTGVTLDSTSVGTLRFTITDDEFTAGTASLVACDGAIPEDVSFALYDSYGQEVESVSSVVDGIVTFSVIRPEEPATVLARPSAVWNCDFVDGETRGGFTLGLGGNATNANGEVVIASGNYGVSVMNSTGFANTASRFIAVAAITNVVPYTDADTGVFYTARSSSGDNRIGVHSDYCTLYGWNNGTEKYGLTPSAATYPTDGGLHWLGAYYSTDRVPNYASLGGKGTYAYIDINSESAVSAGKDGLVYSGDTAYYGMTFGGLYGSSDRQLVGARIRCIAMFTNVQAVATNVISQWTLDSMTAAESPADGDAIAGGENVGVNLSGGRVNVSDVVTNAALFVQADTTLVFGDGATLEISGPLYIAAGAHLKLATSTPLDSKTPSRALLTAAALACEESQVSAELSRTDAVEFKGRTFSLVLGASRPLVIVIK
ncbi:MAG: hypothetical protein K6F50_03075 [Kiritimatiellae bacterium]|nr:hypothetical protein [Kiritimatiellia bacterium]